MEQETEYLAKIIGNDFDILLKNETIIIGRGDSLELSNEAKGNFILNNINFFRLLKNCWRG